MGATRTPPMLVGDPVPTERPAAHSCKATRTTDPPIPSTGPARRRTPVSDLFHEPEAHPKTAATGIPPMVTVRGHRPAPGTPPSHTSSFTTACLQSCRPTARACPVEQRTPHFWESTRTSRSRRGPRSGGFVLRRSIMMTLPIVLQRPDRQPTGAGCGAICTACGRQSTPDFGGATG